MNNSANTRLFKILFMLPTTEEKHDSTVESLKTFFSTLVGFESLCVFKLSELSGDPSNVWLFQWIIEVFFNFVAVTPHDLMDEIRNSEQLPKEWKVCAFTEELQITPNNI